MGKRSCGDAPPVCPDPCPQTRFRRTRLPPRRPVRPPVGSPPSRSLRRPSPGRRSSRGSSTLGASGPDPPFGDAVRRQVPYETDLPAVFGRLLKQLDRLLDQLIKVTLFKVQWARARVLQEIGRAHV